MRRVKLFVMLFSCVALLFVFAPPAFAAINIIDCRTMYTDEYNGATNYYEPGSPSRTMTVPIKYTVGGPGTYRITVYDRGSGTNKADVTMTLSSGGTYWAPTIQWTWKSTADSHEVRAYQQTGPNTWTLQDNFIGSVPADKSLQGSAGHHWWSPNQYTWGYKWNQTTNYVWYYQHYWFRDDSVTGFYRGTQRLITLKNLIDNIVDGQLQHEYQRSPVGSEGNQEGWDALYIGQSGQRIGYGFESNLPGARQEGEELSLGGDEEIQSIAETPAGLGVLDGHDPTGLYPYGYYTKILFYRIPAYRNQNFWMRTSFECKESFYDTSFDIEEATVHTTPF